MSDTVQNCERATKQARVIFGNQIASTKLELSTQTSSEDSQTDFAQPLKNSKFR